MAVDTFETFAMLTLIKGGGSTQIFTPRSKSFLKPNIAVHKLFTVCFLQP